MEHNNGGNYNGHFSKKLKAGKRRTYFFDVKSTKQGDFFLTVTESKKKFDSDNYENHKIFLYKEDFKKFLEALNEAVDYIKTDLMPDYDYETEREAWTPNNHVQSGVSQNHQQEKTEQKLPPPAEDNPNASAPQIADDEVIDWN